MELIKKDNLVHELEEKVKKLEKEKRDLKKDNDKLKKDVVNFKSEVDKATKKAAEYCNENTVLKEKVKTLEDTDVANMDILNKYNELKKKMAEPEKRDEEVVVTESEDDDIIGVEVLSKNKHSGYRRSNPCEAPTVAPKPQQNIITFKCTWCRFQSKDESALRTHMVQKHHSCDICSVSFKTVFSLREHMKNVHKKVNGTLIKCNHCDFGGLNKRHLHQHTIRHHRKESKCNECHFKTFNEHELRDHITKQHRRVKNVTCRYWLNGNCRREQCLFRHEGTLCKFGNNCGKSFCKLDHPTQPAPSAPNLNPWSHPAPVGQNLCKDKFPFLGQSQAQSQCQQCRPQSRSRGL